MPRIQTPGRRCRFPDRHSGQEGVLLSILLEKGSDEMIKFRLLLGALGLTAVLAAGQPAHAASVTAYVGYADDVRSSPFFPNPWEGSPDVLFLGSGSDVDSGAFRLDNTGSSDL